MSVHRHHVRLDQRVSRRPGARRGGSRPGRGRRVCYSHTGLLGVPRGRAHTAHCWPPGHRRLHARRGGKRRVEGWSRTFAGDRRVLNGPVVIPRSPSSCYKGGKGGGKFLPIKDKQGLYSAGRYPRFTGKAIQLESLLVVRGRTACSVRGGWLGAAGRAALLSY